MKTASAAKAPILEHEVVEELVEEWSTEVGQRIRRQRKVCGFTLQVVSDLTGVSKQTIHRAEYDGASVRDDVRHLIAIALGSEVSTLWAPMTSEQMRRRAKAVA